MNLDLFSVKENRRAIVVLGVFFGLTYLFGYFSTSKIWSCVLSGVSLYAGIFLASYLEKRFLPREG